MPRFNIKDTENYGGTGGGGYFSLKNDGDTKRVRFLYRGIEDVEGLAVHEVEINGRKRYVNCLRSYDEPMDKCPFCRNRMFTTAKFFIPLYDIEDKRNVIWERGKNFAKKLTSICGRFANNESLCNHVFEIERNGKAGSKETTYEIYEISADGTELEDLPEVETVLGTLVLEKSAEQMEEYLETGKFADEEEVVSNNPRSNETYRRRTPATSRTRVEDVY